MASNFPGALDSLTNPVGTNTQDSPDHAAQHTNANDIIEAIESNLGTNSGTSMLKHFTVGQFAVRHTGVAATGTLVQTLVGGTLNAQTMGSPAITGGTLTSPVLAGGNINNGTLGTPTITVSSDATGDLFFRSAGGTLNRLGVGTQGQFLRTAGTPALPAWQTASFLGAPISGSGSCTANTSANSTSVVDITGMTTNLVLGASNYTVFVWAYQGIFGDVVADQAQLQTVIGSGTSAPSYLRIDAAQSSATWPAVNFHVLATQTGTVTVKAQIARQSGSGTVSAANAHGRLLAIAFPE